MMKICRTCGETKSPEEFYPYPHSEDGLSYHCKHCRYSAIRRTQLMRWYGMTQQDWDDLYEHQEGRCAACQRPFGDGDARPVVDHQAGGATRGLLCNRCNTVLGRVEDSADILRGLYQYLISPPAMRLWEEPKVGQRQQVQAGSRYRRSNW